MHRSRIGVVLIDHPEKDWEEGLGFWAGVQGVEPTLDEGDEEVYRSIGPIGSASLASQRTGDGTPARVHLDIETDDVAAEVARVVALGARSSRTAATTRSCATRPASSSASCPCRPATCSSATPGPGPDQARDRSGPSRERRTLNTHRRRGCSLSDHSSSREGQ